MTTTNITNKTFVSRAVHAIDKLIKAGEWHPSQKKDAGGGSDKGVYYGITFPIDEGYKLKPHNSLSVFLPIGPVAGPTKADTRSGPKYAPSTSFLTESLETKYLHVFMNAVLLSNQYSNVGHRRTEQTPGLSRAEVLEQCKQDNNYIETWKNVDGTDFVSDQYFASEVKIYNQSVETNIIYYPDPKVRLTYTNMKSYPVSFTSPTIKETVFLKAFMSGEPATQNLAIQRERALNIEEKLMKHRDYMVKTSIMAYIFANFDGISQDTVAKLSKSSVCMRAYFQADPRTGHLLDSFRRGDGKSNMTQSPEKTYEMFAQANGITYEEAKVHILAGQSESSNMAINDVPAQPKARAEPVEDRTPRNAFMQMKHIPTYTHNDDYAESIH